MRGLALICTYKCRYKIRKYGNFLSCIDCRGIFVSSSPRSRFSVKTEKSWAPCSQDVPDNTFIKRKKIYLDIVRSRVLGLTSERVPFEYFDRCLDSFEHDFESNNRYSVKTTDIERSKHLKRFRFKCINFKSVNVGEFKEPMRGLSNLTDFFPKRYRTRDFKIAYRTVFSKNNTRYRRKTIQD